MVSLSKDTRHPLEDTSHHARGRLASLRTRSSITVVGGGVIGCAVAYELARRGADLCVMDCRDVGQGATQASAGMLAPFTEAGHPGPLRELGCRSLSLYDRFVADVVDHSGAAIPYERTGTIEIASDRAALFRLERTSHELAAAGIKCRLLDRAAARATEPHLGSLVTGALLVPSHGFVGAAALTAALRRGAERYGASFLTPRTVTRVCPVADGLALDTDQGSWTSDTVVLAAGCWGGRVRVDGEAPLPVRPVRGQLLRLRGAAGACPSRIVWSPRCYVVPWRDGTILVGATVEEVGFDERATVAGVTGLLDAVQELLPAMTAAEFREVRVGLRPGSPDDMPVIGRSRSLPNLLYAAGHYRNGVLLAPLTAELIADLVLDEKSDPLLEAVAPGRFEAASRPDAGISRDVRREPA